jgi:hypothetical protein
MSRRRRKGGAGGGGRPVTHLGSATTAGRPEVEGARIIRGRYIDLGDLDEGAEEVRELQAEFRYAGVKFRVHPDLSELVVIDLLEEGDAIDVHSPKAMIFAKTYMRAFVHPDDFGRFWALVLKRAPSVQKLMELSWKILGGITEGPTGGQSDSSDGQPATSQSSQHASSTPAAPRDRREAFLQHIQRIEARTDQETGQPMPINAAVAAQLVVAAKAQGIDLAGQLADASA